jgi:hypothetical protein
MRTTALRRALPIALLLASASLASACVGGSKLSAEEKERLKPYILDAPPADMGQKTDINFENKVHIIGFKAEPELAKPGTDVKITYYWRCEDPIEQGWQLFTHAEREVEGDTRAFDNLDGNGPLREIKSNRQVLGPDRWERGKVYVDEQTYHVPEKVVSPFVTVYLGIYKGDARLRVISGPNDGDNRAITVKLKTGLAPKPEPKTGALEVPTLKAVKLGAKDKIKVDGKGDDAPWGAAASTSPFVDVGTGRPSPSFPVQGAAKVAWDDQNLYLLIDVKDPNVVGFFTSKDKQPDSWTATGQPMLWTKHTAEVMIDPDGDGDNKDYFELQINPQNKVFKSRFDEYNKPKVEPKGPFGHEDWDPKLTSAVVVKGTIDKPDDKDEGYTVEVAIPWKAFEKGAKNLPPKSGDTWRVNFYAMQDNGGTAWSPILGQGNFHKATRFGKITFVTSADAATDLDASAPSDASARADAGAGPTLDASAATRPFEGGIPPGLRQRLRAHADGGT